MQTAQDYRRTINVTNPSDEAFEKIGNVRDWWADNTIGETHELGGNFTIHFSEETFVAFRITEAIPGTKIVWLVEDCYLHWLTDKKEWNGTRVIFDVAEIDGKTSVTMTHEGLHPRV